MYELGQAIVIVVIACLILYGLRRLLAKLFGVTRRKVNAVPQEMRQAYYEGLVLPTPKEERTEEK